MPSAETWLRIMSTTTSFTPEACFTIFTKQRRRDYSLLWGMNPREQTVRIEAQLCTGSNESLLNQVRPHEKVCRIPLTSDRNHPIRRRSHFWGSETNMKLFIPARWRVRLSHACASSIAP